MKYVTKNHVMFPNNVLEPKKITIDDDEYTLYTSRFDGLYDLYNYLKEEPEINHKVWNDNKLESINNDFDFAGKPYDEAVEDLIGDIDPGYKEFLKIEKNINARNGSIHKYKTIKTVAGGHVNVPAYTAGNPLIYDISRKITKPKFINVNISLSYYCGTTKEQVFNKAIIITNIIKALENAGYSVNINAFELSYELDELFQIIFSIKKYGEKINYPALYKSLCNVEFLRRICFRVLETSDVKEKKWSYGYGYTCSECFIRKVLKINKDDLFFDQPRDMGIRGYDLADDFEVAVKHLKLDNVIDVNQEIKDFEKKVKILKK